MPIQPEQQLICSQRHSLPILRELDPLRPVVMGFLCRPLSAREHPTQWFLRRVARKLGRLDGLMPAKINCITSSERKCRPQGVLGRLGMHVGIYSIPMEVRLVSTDVYESLFASDWFHAAGAIIDYSQGLILYNLKSCTSWACTHHIHQRRSCCDILQRLHLTCYVNHDHPWTRSNTGHNIQWRSYWIRNGRVWGSSDK